MTKEIILTVVIVCLAVSPYVRASERSTALAEASPMKDKALARPGNGFWDEFYLLGKSKENDYAQEKRFYAH